MYKRVFKVADHESGIRIWKIKMADSIWQLFQVRIAVFWVIHLEKGIRGFTGLLITNMNSEFRYTKWWTQYGDYFRLKLQFYIHVVCSGSRREERTEEIFFVKSAIFDPIQSVRVWSSISNSLSQFRKDWINITNYYNIIMNVIILSPFYPSPLFAFDYTILNFEILIPDSWSATPKTYGNTIDTHCKSSIKMCPSKG